MVDEINELGKKRTIIFTTHNVDELKRLNVKQLIDIHKNANGVSEMTVYKGITKKQKDEFIKVMTSGWKMPRENSAQRGYDKAVDIWIDTFEPDEEKGIKKFNVNDNGAYIMPDYTKLETCS